MIRKLIAVILVIMTMLTLVPAMGEGADMPAAVKSYFSDAKYSGCTYHGHGEAGNWYFVLLKDGKNTNVLFGFKKDSSGNWKYSFRTSEAVFQSKNSVILNVSTDGYLDWGTDERITNPAVLISLLGENGEYTDAFLAFVLRDGVWKFTRYWNKSTGATIRGYDERLTYYRDIESAGIRGSAYGTYQRDIRYFSLSALPKTLDAAQNKLSSAPAIPLYGNLSAEEVKFTSGKKYSVYQGPGTQYGQGGNGKAKVSTNDWIQVFGQENGWIMIQYDITSDHMRIGWIEASALPRNKTVKTLNFEALSAYTLTQVSMTDDPLLSKTSIGMIPQGTSVKWLATMGEWAYVEVNSGTPVRGFVLSSSLNTSTHMTREQAAAAAKAVIGTNVEPYEVVYNAADHAWVVTFIINGNVTNVVVSDVNGSVGAADGSNG